MIPLLISLKIYNRHIKQLESLLALMPADSHPMKVTDNKDDVLEMLGCLNGVYLQVCQYILMLLLNSIHLNLAITFGLVLLSNLPRNWFLW